jgi:cobalt/nickel transport system permease protein
MRGHVESLPTPSSPVSRLDPRWKLAALVLAGAGVVALENLLPAALAFLGAVGVAVLARLPLRWSLSRLGLAVLVLSPFLVLLPFVQRESEPLWSIGPLHFSMEGVWLALVLACKSLALVLIVLTLLASTSLTGLFKAAQALRVPGLVVHMAALAYRYIGVLATELDRLRLALRVRGYRNRATVHCYRTVGHVAGTLFVRGYEQAERVEQAMKCRGFDGRFRTLHDFQTGWADVVFFVLTTAGAGGLVVLDVFGRP